MDIPFTRILVEKDDYVPTKIFVWIVVATIDIRNIPQELYDTFHYLQDICVIELDYDEKANPIKILVIIDQPPHDSPLIIATLTSSIILFNGTFEEIPASSLDDIPDLADKSSGKKRLLKWLNR